MSAPCRHTCLVFYSRSWRDLWMKLYWVGCVRCELEEGPYPLGMAREACRLYNKAAGIAQIPDEG